MGQRGHRRPPPRLVAVSEPDPAMASEGLRLLGRMIAQAIAKGNGDGDPAWVPPEEESGDTTEY